MQHQRDNMPVPHGSKDTDSDLFEELNVLTGSLRLDPVSAQDYHSATVLIMGVHEQLLQTDSVEDQGMVASRSAFKVMIRHDLTPPANNDGGATTAPPSKTSVSTDNQHNGKITMVDLQQRLRVQLANLLETGKYIRQATDHLREGVGELGEARGGLNSNLSRMKTDD